MKTSSGRCLALFLLSSQALCGQSGVLDLTRLANYANQPVPAYILRDNTPGAPNPNPITDAGATLGRVLFYDKRLSRNATISCASCHQQDQAFGDGAVASTGVAGTTGRHSMRLVNSRFSAERRFFWDERAATLEQQTTQPIQDHVEMGFSGTEGDPAFADLVARLSAIEEYRVLFEFAFGSTTIDETRIRRALAQFVRSIQSFDSKYDVGRAQVANNTDPFPNFTTQENNGKTLFATPPNQGGAGCAGCHRPPEFDIDPNSLNNGVIAALTGGTDLTNTRSPSLRDLTRPDPANPNGAPNGPFMHDGSLVDLAAVISHYIAPPDNANLDPRLRRPPLNLNPQQRANLVAFLRTLAGSALYTDPKWSDPFDAGGRLSLIVLSEVAVERPGGGLLRLTSSGVPGLEYVLQHSPDLSEWTLVTELTADAEGVLAHEIATGGERGFYRFIYTPPAG
jgi:cytochrome c peroxidase